MEELGSKTGIGLEVSKVTAKEIQRIYRLVRCKNEGDGFDRPTHRTGERGADDPIERQVDYRPRHPIYLFLAIEGIPDLIPIRAVRWKT
jgi:hypothetical protein